MFGFARIYGFGNIDLSYNKDQLSKMVVLKHIKFEIKNSIILFYSQGDSFISAASTFLGLNGF